MLLDEITEESSEFLPILGDEKELLNTTSTYLTHCQFYRFGIRFYFRE